MHTVAFTVTDRLADPKPHAEPDHFTDAEPEPEPDTFAYAAAKLEPLPGSNLVTKYVRADPGSDRSANRLPDGELY